MKYGDGGRRDPDFPGKASGAYAKNDESEDRDGSPGVQSLEDSDEKWMREAMVLATQALQAGEVPVGAVVVLDGQAIGRGYNCPIANCDPTAHAEILALREASRHRANCRIAGAILYSTLEPCAMCAGAAVLARVGRLVFAARDLRFGAVRSKFRLADSVLLNHRIQVEEGLFAVEAVALLQEFFASKRRVR